MSMHVFSQAGKSIMYCPTPLSRCLCNSSPMGIGASQQQGYIVVETNYKVGNDPRKTFLSVKGWDLHSTTSSCKLRDLCHEPLLLNFDTGSEYRFTATCGCEVQWAIFHMQLYMLWGYGLT